MKISKVKVFSAWAGQQLFVLLGWIGARRKFCFYYFLFNFLQAFKNTK
ncbi:unnamed protein product [Paramecium octaurelia]|uniref:Uncharacterized protein n=1 Tax=Paramecium octaurelia TaxID=43137 RepID=A0A8S1RYK6_PAROT|nr:unnamed protein product [Paramecium octaurelia]